MATSIPNNLLTNGKSASANKMPNTMHTMVNANDSQRYFPMISPFVAPRSRLEAISLARLLVKATFKLI